MKLNNILFIIPFLIIAVLLSMLFYSSTKHEYLDIIVLKTPTKPHRKKQEKQVKKLNLDINCYDMIEN